jgi:hypothetical protein
MPCTCVLHKTRQPRDMGLALIPVIVLLRNAPPYGGRVTTAGKCARAWVSLRLRLVLAVGLFVMSESAPPFRDGLVAIKVQYNGGALRYHHVQPNTCTWTCDVLLDKVVLPSITTAAGTFRRLLRPDDQRMILSVALFSTRADRLVDP